MANLIEGIQKIVELLLAIENTYIMSDATKEEAKQEYLRILSQTKQKIVQDKVKEAFEGQTLTFKEIESKPTNKNIKILYSDSFCRCIYNEETKEIDFATCITGESLHYNLLGNYHEQVLFFINKNDEKSFDVHSSTWFPYKGVSGLNDQWKKFCYLCMSYILQNEIKDNRLCDLPDSLHLYIEAVDTMFQETFFMGYNRIRSGKYPPQGGLIINEYTLHRQNKIIKKWDDYTATHIDITESILYEITKVIGIGSKLANKNIKILYKDSFCKCIYNQETEEIDFEIFITGKPLRYNISGNYYEQVLFFKNKNHKKSFFKNKNDKKSFDVHGETWFPDKGLSDSTEQWKIFCYSCMSYIVQNEIKDKRLYDLPDLLHFYIEAVDTMFQETFFMGYNRIKAGKYLLHGDLIIKEYILNRQHKPIKKWDDYTATHIEITESILYEIRKVIETGRKIESELANKNIKILYKDSFCRCIYNEETEEIDFATCITGESLRYNLSENFYEQVFFFKNKNDEKSFDVHSSTWFPDKESDSTEQWKIFCYSCMSYILQNEIKDKRLYDLPDSLHLYVKAVDTMFEETFFMGYNRIRAGMYPPQGGLIINEYTLHRQNKIIKKWDDYTATHIHITESILYEIRKVIETGRKLANKNIKILYSDSFCRCIYNEETEETDFSTYITGESLHYNLSENYHEQVLFFKNKNDEKSFDVHSSTCFPDKGSDSTEQWKIFCYSCMSYILQNEIKDKILYDVPDSVKLYIKAVDTIFEEKISISYNDPIRTGIYPPKGGLILYRQNKIIKKWDDYTTTHIHITEAIESILYEIRKVITK